MTFEIDVNGRTHAVSVERLPSASPPAGGAAPSASPAASPSAGGAASSASTAHRFRVTIDGTAHLVDAARVDGDALSLIRADGRTHHVAVSDTGGDLTLAFPEGVVLATVNGRRARRSRDSAGPTGAQRIAAPMPGKVLRVLVRPGDEVAARQPLVVVEAMKMENELSSPKAGRVKDVPAVEGQSVEAGRLLVVVE